MECGLSSEKRWRGGQATRPCRLVKRFCLRKWEAIEVVHAGKIKDRTAICVEKRLERG